MSPKPRAGFDPAEVPPWEQPGPVLTSRSAADIEPTRPTWVWERWLAAGNLHLLVGRQGHGKSTFASWVVGNVSAGRSFPGDGTTHAPTRCALLSLEEPADRLVARLTVTGAELSSILILGDIKDVDDEGRAVRRPWRLPADCGALEQLLRDEDIGLVVIDGLGYTVNGDTHNYGVVGAALSALAALAERTGCAVLGLTHPPKGSSDPATVAIGSTAWTAVARVVWLLGIDPDDETETRRVVQVAKSNFHQPDAGLSFVIGDDPTYECGFVTAVQPSHVTAEAIAAASVPADEKSEREEARDIVRSILKDGPMSSTDLLKLTAAAGVAQRTVERARRDLGVKAVPIHDGRRITGWQLTLPDNPATTPPATPPLPNPGGLGGVGGLALNRGNSNTPRIKTAKDANTARVTPLGAVGDRPFYDRDEF